MVDFVHASFITFIPFFLFHLLELLLFIHVDFQQPGFYSERLQQSTTQETCILLLFHNNCQILGFLNTGISLNFMHSKTGADPVIWKAGARGRTICFRDCFDARTIFIVRE